MHDRGFSFLRSSWRTPKAMDDMGGPTIGPDDALRTACAFCGFCGEYGLHDRRRREPGDCLEEACDFRGVSGDVFLRDLCAIGDRLCRVRDERRCAGPNDLFTL